MNQDDPEGATPLTPTEEEGLIPSHITLRSELNELEQANILEAETWLQTRERRSSALDPLFLKALHRRMFGTIWKWAGHYRKADRNIGVHWPMISSQLELLCREATAWRDEKAFTPDELAIRFHHKLVWIHCYPNGNGRHARLAADLLVMELGSTRFSWGGDSNLESPTEIRKHYIDSLKSADQHDHRALLAFARR
ncbi:MAG: mobile mystery protein B [Verrucomicrobia bacterium]|nr:mobile mystery protein B [Verrucomicrobiota bacterium]